MIGIDATGMWGQTFGIHIYAAQLVENLLLNPDTQNRYRIYCRREVPSQFRHGRTNNEFPVAPFRNRKICEQVWLSAQLATKSVSLFHATFGKPLFCPAPYIITVHDLFVVRFPEKYPAWLKAYHRIAIENAAKSAEFIITVSEYSKRDIMEYLGIPEDRIKVIPLAVDKKRCQPATESRQQGIRSTYNLPKRFILHVGGFSQIKNTVRVVEAFNKLLEDDGEEELGLVFAGSSGGSEYTRTFDTVMKYGLEKKVTFTGYLPDSHLSPLYSAAHCVIVSSLIEGFGLPVLESLQCGTPVICSHAGSLPEVAGDAAIYFPPTDTDAITNAMSQMVSDRDIYLNVKSKAIQQAGKFSWESTASETYKVYQQFV